VEQKQGGPSIQHCKSVVSEQTVDLVHDTWTSGICTAFANPSGDGSEPLTVTRGKLTPAARATLEAGYGKLTIAPARGCGHDGGTLTIRVTSADGASASYVDENWGCKSPPPVVASGARDFSMTLRSVLAP
jgi:hypothetical protein